MGERTVQEISTLERFGDLIKLNATIGDVMVEGDLDGIGSASGSESYQFRAGFDANVRSLWADRKERFVYRGAIYLHQPGEPESDKDCFIDGSLKEIKKYLNECHSKLPTWIDGHVLRVGRFPRGKE